MIVGDTVSTVCMMVLIALFLTENASSFGMPGRYWAYAVRCRLFRCRRRRASTYMLVPESYLLRAAGFNQSLQSLTVVAAAPGCSGH